MIDPLMTLLDSSDPDVRTQGVELARALGREATDRVLASCVLEADGRLWRPLGLSESMLSLLLDAPPSTLVGIRRLSLCGRTTSDLLARLASRIPGLEELTLSASGLEDLTVLTGSVGLSRLSLLRTTVDDLAPLTKLPRLKHLSLDHCRVLSMGALPRLAGLESLSMEDIDAPSADMPAGLTALNVCRYHSTVRNFDALSLRSLTLHTGQLKFAAPILPRLSHLRLTGCQDAAPLAGLPVTDLELDIASAGEDALPPLMALPRLTALNLTPTYINSDLSSLAAISAHPALSVVSLPRHIDRKLQHYAPTWVPGVAQTQRLSSGYMTSLPPLGTPEILRRAAARWQGEGYRHQLTLVSLTDAMKRSKIRSIKTLRVHVTISLRDAKNLFDALLSDGLKCLRLEEAVEIQGWLRLSGISSRISPWLLEAA